MLTTEKISELISTIKIYTNFDFSQYAVSSFTRRIEKILEDNNIDVDKFIKQIKKSDKLFVDKLIADITVNTTELFRDPSVWQSIKYRILSKYEQATSIDIWHVGCSTGQEVYSMLILLNELNLLEKTNIYATDINNFALQNAQQGKFIYRFNAEYLQNFDEVIKKNPYNFEEFNDVPYSKYFFIDKAKDIIQINDFLRNKAVFVNHDITSLYNIFEKKFDIILCRNVLIYFNQILQSKVINFFYDNLRYPGNLVLGYHESILGNESLKFHKKHFYYTKRPI